MRPRSKRTASIHERHASHALDCTPLPKHTILHAYQRQVPSVSQGQACHINRFERHCCQHGALLARPSARYESRGSADPCLPGLGLAPWLHAHKLPVPVEAACVVGLLHSQSVQAVSRSSQDGGIEGQARPCAQGVDAWHARLDLHGTAEKGLAFGDCTIPQLATTQALVWCNDRAA